MNIVQLNNSVFKIDFDKVLKEAQIINDLCERLSRIEYTYSDTAIKLLKFSDGNLAYVETFTAPLFYFLRKNIQLGYGIGVSVDYYIIDLMYQMKGNLTFLKFYEITTVE